MGILLRARPVGALYKGVKPQLNGPAGAGIQRGKSALDSHALFGPLRRDIERGKISKAKDRELRRGGTKQKPSERLR